MVRDTVAMFHVSKEGIDEYICIQGNRVECYTVCTRSDFALCSIEDVVKVCLMPDGEPLYIPQGWINKREFWNFPDRARETLTIVRRNVNENLQLELNSWSFHLFFFILTHSKNSDILINFKKDKIIKGI